MNEDKGTKEANGSRSATGFIGAGNMGAAMIRALTNSGVLGASEIMVINRTNRRRIDMLARECGVIKARSLKEMAAACSTLVVCTKPDQVAEVLDEIAPVLDEHQLLISVAAGVSIGFIRSRLCAEVPVVRSMPNTPVQVGEGVIALSAAGNVSPRQRERAEELFRPLGTVVWVEEGDIDIVTALSGSGPAYFYRLALEMAASAEEMGLDRALARDLARRTLIGAGLLLKEESADIEELLRRVVSPRGTTQAALGVFDTRHLSAIVREAMNRAAARAAELSGVPDRRVLSRARRVVVKVGSSVITAGDGELNLVRVKSVVDQISKASREGRQMLLVSSGAVACGRGRMKRMVPDSLTAKQALAAIGQGLLMQTYEALFDAHGITVAQVLLTREDLSSPKRSSLCRSTLEELLSHGVIPIINENDTVAVDEIKLGDNDTLSARVAVLTRADLLVILTDTDGLYTNDPRLRPDATRLSRVRDITGDVLQMAQGLAGPGGTGGMLTKMWAANLAMEHGVPVVIASGLESQALTAVLEGGEVGTLFWKDAACTRPEAGETEGLLK